MMNVQEWSREYVLNNQEACVQKLSELTKQDRSDLNQNLKQEENGKLVLLRGMISDLREPEFYCEKIVVKTSSNTERIELGRYTDKLNIEENEKFDDNMENLSERNICIVMKPSSTNSWVNEELEVGEKTSNKRKLEDEAENVQKSSPSFVVKIYENFDMPLNTVVEVVGFLLPSLKTSADEFGVQAEALPDFTIHAVTIRELPHNNPLLTDLMVKDESYSFKDIQQDLLKLLTDFMFGDKVAAQYLLCHLISNVYARVSGEVLGKFSLNLTFGAVPKELHSDHIKKIYNLLEILLPDSSYFPLTIENFNETSFVPKKDYTKNHLQTGVLQLPKHAHLVLDETKLENGKLEQSGCLAVGDLSELIRSQQISYDFGFYKLPFQTNIPVLIFSEGKSLLPSDFIVAIKPVTDSLQLINENVAAGFHFLKPKLNAVRKYLTECRLCEFEIGEEETKLIESDFVQMREDKSLSVEHLHSLLVVSRLIGISEGKSKLDSESWKTAKELEHERLSRIGKSKNEV